MRSLRSLLALACLIGAAAAQQVYRATTKLVNVAFIATDAEGALVRNLRQDELQVYEDGAAQKIAFFSPSYDLPLSLGVLLDISGSQSKFLDQHRKDLTSFLQAVLQTHDRAFLVCIDNHLRLVSDYTPSGATLLWTLEHFRVKFGYPELGPAQPERQEGTGLFDGVYYAANAKLAGQSGRHVLLLYSDGEDNASAQDEGGAIAAAENADATVYTIRYTDAGKPGARDQYGMAVMNRLAAETGGVAVDGRQNDPKRYLPGIAEELRGGYQLAYYPAGAGGAGFHKIVIRCTRPGVTIRARSGYAEAAN